MFRTSKKFIIFNKSCAKFCYKYNMEESLIQTRTNIVDDCKSKKVWKCRICLEELRDPVCTPFGHLFCLSYIYKWLKDQSKPCPVCKSIVLKLDSNIISIYNGPETNVLIFVACPNTIHMSSQTNNGQNPPCPHAILTPLLISKNIILSSCMTTSSRPLAASDSNEFGPSIVLTQNINKEGHICLNRIQILSTEFELIYTYNRFNQIQIEIEKTNHQFYTNFEMNNCPTQVQTHQINNLLDQPEFQLQDITNCFFNNLKVYFQIINNHFNLVQQTNFNPLIKIKFNNPTIFSIKFKYNF